MSSLAVTPPIKSEVEQSSATTLSQKGRRFDQIDALRGLAALMVVCHHSQCMFNDSFRPTLTLFGHIYYPLSIFNSGYIGVDLFLVLSGFCLSWPFLAKHEKPFDIKDYAARRIQRIYPAYFLCFSGLLLGGLLCRHSHVLRLQDVGFAKPLSGTQILASLGLQMTHLNPVFWSLCLEFRWYILFPVMLLLARKRSAWLLLPFALLSTMITPDVQTGMLAVLKVFSYLTAFIVGIIAAEVHARPELRLHKILRKWAFGGVVLFGIVCALVIPTVTPAQRCGFREVLPTAGLFFFVVLWALEYQKRLPPPLNVLRAVGVFSYSLYLVHLPLLELVQAVLKPEYWSPPMQGLLWIVLAPIAMTGMGYLFFLVAEKPFLKKPFPVAMPVWRWSRGESH
jgi:peptidoglycan/LPS O-acetylase OafA/YrhL